MYLLKIYTKNYWQSAHMYVCMDLCISRIHLYSTEIGDNIIKEWKKVLQVGDNTKEVETFLQVGDKMSKKGKYFYDCDKRST